MKKFKSANGGFIMGVDPGLQGAFVALNPSTGEFEYSLMPVTATDKQKEVRYIDVCELLMYYPNVDHVFLERAMPMAMGSKHAFNYGRGFASIEIAIQITELPVTYVEPTKWCKEMHAGISNDLKAKAKSIIAINRLFPKLVKEIPTNKNGKLHEGVVDALLIAHYGARIITGKS